MKSQLILVAVVALVAGVVGGYIGSSAGGEDDAADTADASETAEPAKPVEAPSLRSLSDELELIEARGGWELRKTMLEVQPVRLEVGSETLVYAPSISWKPGETLDVDYKFYRFVGGKLELVDIKKE